MKVANHSYGKQILGSLTVLETLPTQSMHFFFLASRKQIELGLVFCQADGSPGQGVEMTAHGWLLIFLERGNVLSCV